MKWSLYHGAHIHIGTFFSKSTKLIPFAKVQAILCWKQINDVRKSIECSFHYVVWKASKQRNTRMFSLILFLEFDHFSIFIMEYLLAEVHGHALLCTWI
jgi:hypothetical protein